MASPRTETLRIDLTKEDSLRVKKACAKLRISPSDIFEMGFNAVFPKTAPPRPIFKPKV